ncbi:MAG: hypothetical protein HYR48_02240 [Gemmatimonadetes bacterium]|nr:hypothetical protein [Gemmatimonadota bacterium]
MTAKAIALAAACALAASGLAAQVPRSVALAGTGTTMRLRSATTTGSEALSGMAFGVEGALLLRPVTISAGYWEGSLKPDSGNPTPRDLVEGWAFLGVRPVSWLLVRGGAHLRGYVTAAGTARRIYWETRARADAPLVGRTAEAYFELWRAWSGGAGAADRLRSARGGEGGLVVRRPQTPFWARLAYRIDRTTLRNDARVEIVDGVSLTVGIGGR